LDSVDDSDSAELDCNDSDGADLDCGDSELDWSGGLVPDGCEGGSGSVASVLDYGVGVEVFMEAFCVDSMDCEAFRFLELDKKSVGVTTRPSDKSCKGMLKS
jgi:hypothetical protein